MLFTQTIEPGTLSVLKKLMDLPELNPFCLVGGTALSLKYGHRKSIDLDLFSSEQFDNEEIIDVLQTKFGDSFVYQSGKWGIFAFIEKIKVDIIHYPHPIIGKIEIVDNIRFYNNQDLIAMKLQAILGRGVKKDFWDIAQLFEEYTLEEMIYFHSQKYPNQMLVISIPQALTYFSDAEESENPVTLNNWKWADIKRIISENVRSYLGF